MVNKLHKRDVLLKKTWFNFSFAVFYTDSYEERLSWHNITKCARSLELFFERSLELLFI